MAAADRPLLVVHDEEEGYLIYDLCLLESDDTEGAPLLASFPRPASCFGTPPWMQAFAVSGGHILGACYSFWSNTLFHDTVMKVGGYDYFEQQPDAPRDAEGRATWWWPMGRHLETNRQLGTQRDVPAMLPLAGGAAVVRMDTVLFDGAYCFEVLRPAPGGESWRTTPIPKPPVGGVGERDVSFVSAYFAVGTRVWISVTGRGTFSFDAGEHGRGRGAWRFEGPWELPFEGRALHVPELGAAVVVGLAAGTRLLCACHLSPGAQPALRHVWGETHPRPSEECAGGLRPRDMATLAYLGEGRFCICRPMSTRKPAAYADPPVLFNAGCFLVVQLRRLPGGELQLAKRGKMTYMWPPQGKQWPSLGFIQPATS
ncbi:hypothetical protein ACP4OV_002983 [Aristida adscensionis]